MKKTVTMCIVIGILYCVVSQGADTTKQENVVQSKIPSKATFDFSLDTVYSYRGTTNVLRSMQIIGQCELTSKKIAATPGQIEIVATLRDVKILATQDGKEYTNDDLKKEMPNYEGMELKATIDEKGVIHGPSLDQEKAVAPELFKAIICNLPKKTVTVGECWVVENKPGGVKSNTLEYGATTKPISSQPVQSNDSQTDETIVTITTVDKDGSCVATTCLSASGEIISSERNWIKTINRKGPIGTVCLVFKLKRR